MTENTTFEPQYKQKNNTAFKILSVVMVILAIFALMGFYMPVVFFAILNAFWVILLCVTIMFLFLGTLVMIGMKKEVGKILDFVLEGSLTLIDFVDFIRIVIKNFVALVRDFILYISPVLAGLLALVIYLLLMTLYKSVGRLYDVTLLTIVITFALIFAIGFFNKPKKTVEKLPRTWGREVIYRFTHTFNDAIEVVVFIFFITMDSTSLFFLSPDLNVPLRAVIGDYDLMERGFLLNDHLRTTLFFIVCSISIEIVRNILKLIVETIKHYKVDQQLNKQENRNYRAVYIVKGAFRKGFISVKDDLVRFITFTTVLIFVFLFFPRLKLLAMATTSLTFLILDILFTDRLYSSVKSTDLISRILSWVFKI